MSLPFLRIAVLTIALAAMPLCISCGHQDDGAAIEDEEAVAEEIDRYLTQADLKPVDQPEIEEAVDEPGAVTTRADEAAVEAEDDGDEEGLQQIDAEPS